MSTAIISVTILNLVRERLRGTASSGQAGRFNTSSTVSSQNEPRAPWDRDCLLPVLPGLSHTSDTREGG